MLLQYQQYLLLYLQGELYPSCLQAVYPSVYFLLIHCVEYMLELLDVAVGILLGVHAFETVEFFIVEIEVAVVVPFCTVGVFAAAHAIVAAVVVMLFCGNIPVTVEPVQYKKADGNEREYD